MNPKPIIAHETHFLVFLRGRPAIKALHPCAEHDLTDISALRTNVIQLMSYFQTLANQEEGFRRI
jgi:hypothetical protein